MTVNQLLDEHVPKVALIAKNLRALMQTSLLGAEERVYPGWQGITGGASAKAPPVWRPWRYAQRALKKSSLGTPSVSKTVCPF